jgi:hypothetical protein
MNATTSLFCAEATVASVRIMNREIDLFIYVTLLRALVLMQFGFFEQS